MPNVAERRCRIDRIGAVAVLLVTMSLLSGCGELSESPAIQPYRPSATTSAGGAELPGARRETQTQAKAPAAAVKAEQAVDFSTPPPRSGLNELRGFNSVTPDLYCGSQPMSESAFAALKEAGIKTLICLDASVPDVERARAAGLKYVHIPVGFSNADLQAPKVIKAIQTLEGPFYLHCRYGRPRTPFIVAMVCQSTAGWGREQVDNWLFAPGSLGLGGVQRLQRSLQEFTPPSDEDLALLPAEFPERAETTRLAAGMAALLPLWDPIRASNRSNFDDLGSDDMQRFAENVAGMAELFQTLIEDPSVADWGEDFVAQLKNCEQDCKRMRAAFATDARETTEESLQEVLTAYVFLSRRCNECHQRYRD